MKIEVREEVLNAILNSLLKQEAVQLYIALIKEIEECKANIGSDSSSSSD